MAVVKSFNYRERKERLLYQADEIVVVGGKVYPKARVSVWMVAFTYEWSLWEEKKGRKIIIEKNKLVYNKWAVEVSKKFENGRIVDEEIVIRLSVKHFKDLIEFFGMHSDYFKDVFSEEWEENWSKIVRNEMLHFKDKKE